MDRTSTQPTHLLLLSQVGLPSHPSTPCPAKLPPRLPGRVGQVMTVSWVSREGSETLASLLSRGSLPPWSRVTWFLKETPCQPVPQVPRLSQTGLENRMPGS